MKKKSLVVLALTGLLTTSVFYAMPAIAEDAMDANSDEPLQILADNGMQNDATDNADVMANADPNTAVPGSPTATQTTSGNDAGSPDTATGDDDY